MSPVNPLAPPPTKSQAATAVLHRTGVREWIWLAAFWVALTTFTLDPHTAWIADLSFLAGSGNVYLVRRVK